MIPKYIEKKIKQQHRYIALATRLSYEIIEWYDKKMDDSNIPDEEFDDIEFDDIEFEGVKYIHPEAIEYNLALANKK